MKIKFEKKVVKKLEEANKGARVRIGYMGSLTRFLEKIEKSCKYYNIRKDEMEGLEVSYDENAQVFPNAYKYTPYSTIFNCRYEKGGWVVEPKRDVCQGNSHHFNDKIPNFYKLFNAYEHLELKDNFIANLEKKVEYWKEAYRKAMKEHLPKQEVIIK